MRGMSLWLALVTVAAACTPAPRDPAAVGLACETQAARQIPPNTQLRTTPRVAVPPRPVCGFGAFVIQPARVAGGESYSIDLNAGLRRRAVRQCMARALGRG